MTSNASVQPLIRDQRLLAKSYGEAGFKALINSPVVLLCSWAAAMCGFLYGYDQGLINVTLIIPQFLSTFPDVDSDATSRANFWKGLVTAIFELGAVLGALQSAFFCDRISRRYTIIVAVFWYLLGSVLQAAAVNYTMLVFGRLIGGIGVGGASMVAPLYISEIAPPHIRGALLTLQQWMLILGIVAAFYTTYGSRHLESNWAWRTAFVAQILPGTILLGIVSFLPFSPRWLGLVGRDVECLSTLAKLRGLPDNDSRVQAEWINIRIEVQVQERLTGVSHSTRNRTFVQSIKGECQKWALCFDPKYIKRIHIGVVLNAFQQWVGVNGFTYYSTILFQQLGYDYEKRLTLSGLTCICQLVGSTVPIFFIDKVGRRALLLLGTFMLMSCQLINAVIIGVNSGDWSNHQPSAKAGTAFVFIFLFFFEISWGPIAWGVPSEIMPSAIRSQGVALSTASNWASNFVVGLIVPSIVQAAPYGSFALFAGTSFAALIWVYFFVPETKDKSIEELSGAFGDDFGEQESLVYNAVMSEIVSGNNSFGSGVIEGVELEMGNISSIPSEFAAKV